MARLIDADDLKRAVESFAGMLSPAGGFLVRQDAVLRAIELAPTIEAEPVKHGKWVKVAELCGVEVLKCSVCGVSRPRKLTKYCCDCGARMDGE